VSECGWFHTGIYVKFKYVFVCIAMLGAKLIFLHVICTDLPTCVSWLAANTSFVGEGKIVLWHLFLLVVVLQNVFFKFYFIFLWLSCLICWSTVDNSSRILTH